MIVVKLKGGLGNQMFQYAMGKALASRRKTSLVLDLEFLLDRTPDKGPGFVFREYDLDVFKIKPTLSKKGLEKQFTHPSFCQKLKSSFKKGTVFREQHFHFHQEVASLDSEVYLDGYWQSPRYFQEIEKELRNDFLFAQKLEPASGALHAQILATDSICVNVRRGDFLANNFHGVCGMNYFQPAIEYMTNHLNNPHFFVFSDDPDWCKENFTGHHITVVDHTHKGFKFSNQLQLMASCRHFIIPNSTFAWWAVWLSNQPGSKVIAPLHWFSDASIDTRDLIPADWLRFKN